jgi:hypothetical protein
MKATNRDYLMNALSAVAVSLFGILLWNVTFVLYALFVQLVLRLMPVDFTRNATLPMSSLLIVFFLIIAALSWFVFRSRLPDLIKATYATVPLVISLVGIGILTYQIPWLTYALSAAVVTSVLIGLRLAKRSWIYYYAALFTALTLLFFTLSGGEI